MARGEESSKLEASAGAQGAAKPPNFDAPFRQKFRELLVWRRDVRHFRRDLIAGELLDEILSFVALAPSVGLSEPWRLVLVETPELRFRIRENFETANKAALAGYEGEQAALYAQLKLAGLVEAPVHLAVFTDTATSQGHFLGRITMPEAAAYSTVGAIHTLWLAARSYGVGVGWVSILDPAPMTALLGLPHDWSFTAYLCLGYPKSETDVPELERVGWEHRSGPTGKLLRR